MKDFIVERQETSFQVNEKVLKDKKLVEKTIV